MPARSAPKSAAKPKAPAAPVAEVAPAPEPAIAKPEEGAKKAVKHRKANFSIYIHRTLKAVHPKISLGRKALHAMNSIVMSLATKVTDSVTGYVTTKTVTHQAIHDVVRFMFPPELSREAQAAGARAVEAYTASHAEKVKLDHRTRANLVFPPGLAEKFLRHFGRLAVRVGTGAGVYLAAVLQHVATLVLQLSGNVCADEKRVRIKPRHILLAVKNDAELNELLLTKLRVVIAEGGVVPGIHPALLPTGHTPKRRRARAAADEGEGPTKRRFRPGTVALRNIRRQQKNAKLQIQHAPFRRACMDVAVANAAAAPRFSADFLAVFQEYVEARVVGWFEGANVMALHSGRQTVAVKDVHAFVALKEPALYPADSTKCVELSNEGLRRLSQRAGVKMIGAETFLVVKQYLHRLLDSHFRVMCPMLHRDHKKTFDADHVKQTLSLLGVTIAA